MRKEDIEKVRERGGRVCEGGVGELSGGNVYLEVKGVNERIVLGGLCLDRGCLDGRGRVWEVNRRGFVKGVWVV